MPGLGERCNTAVLSQPIERWHLVPGTLRLARCDMFRRMRYRKEKPQNSSETLLACSKISSICSLKRKATVRYPVWAQADQDRTQTNDFHHSRSAVNENIELVHRQDFDCRQAQENRQKKKRNGMTTDQLKTYSDVTAFKVGRPAQEMIPRKPRRQESGRSY